MSTLIVRIYTIIYNFIIRVNLLLVFLQAHRIPHQNSQRLFWASVWFMLDSSRWHEPFGECLSKQESEATTWSLNSPPARWGLLDFMSAAFRSSCLPLLLPSAPPAFRSSCLPLLLPSAPASPAFRFRLLPRPRPPRPPRPTAIRDPHCSVPDLNHDHPTPVFPAGPQPRVSPSSVPCRTSTTTIHAQCSLPDLNREYPRQVFPAGPHVGR